MMTGYSILSGLCHALITVGQRLLPFFYDD